MPPQKVKALLDLMNHGFYFCAHRLSSLGWIIALCYIRRLYYSNGPMRVVHIAHRMLGLPA